MQAQARLKLGYSKTKPALSNDFDLQELRIHKPGPQPASREQDKHITRPESPRADDESETQRCRALAYLH